MEPELPQPDLRDSAGRLRRIAISLFIAIAAGATAYGVIYKVVDPASQPKSMYVNRNMDAGTFVIYATLIVSFLALIAALTIQNRIAKKRSERERVPRAEVR